MSDKPTYRELEKKVGQLEIALSEQEEIAEEAQQSQERFKLLYDRAPLSYQSLDANGCFLEVNKAWLDLFG